MTIQIAKTYVDPNLHGNFRTKLNASDASPLEIKGSIRFTIDDRFGLRGFKYVRFDQSGGALQGELVKKLANVSIANILSGTTTSITTTGLTADKLVGGILCCLDDAGAAGAAPEGEKAMIIANSTTLVEIDPLDAFSVAPAVNDDFMVVLPWATQDSADGDSAGMVQGVAMADQDQYDWGWVQFLGINPHVLVKASTAIPVDESVVADAATVNDGAADAADLRIGRLLCAISSDTVARRAIVDLFCGEAFKMGLSAA